jgi:hypothetical protein
MRNDHENTGDRTHGIVILIACLSRLHRVLDKIVFCNKGIIIGLK